MRGRLTPILMIVAVPAGLAADSMGDSARGAALVRDSQCLQCHRVNGEGGTAASDLGRMTGREYTPASMAATLWNHAPVMWQAMGRRGVTAPVLSEAQAADLFAFFHSLRFFDGLGDAARGKRVFESHKCAECHGISAAVAGGGPAVAQWSALSSPLGLAQQMWNHAPRMVQAMAAKKIAWQPLTAQDLTDLLVYVQNLPQTRGRSSEFSLPVAGRGEALFTEKGCAGCHQGKLALDKRQGAQTMTGFAVAMWNHAPKMAAQGGGALPALDGDEMRQIVSYLWYKEIYSEPGDAGRGAGVFEKKRCVGCHQAGGSGPDLKQRLAGRKDPFRPFSMVSVLWRHGPAMQAQMQAKNMSWPRFTRREMADLITHLNSLH